MMTMYPPKETSRLALIVLCLTLGTGCPKTQKPTSQNNGPVQNFTIDALADSTKKNPTSDWTNIKINTNGIFPIVPEKCKTPNGTFTRYNNPFKEDALKTPEGTLINYVNAYNQQDFQTAEFFASKGGSYQEIVAHGIERSISRTHKITNDLSILGKATLDEGRVVLLVEGTVEDKRRGNRVLMILEEKLWRLHDYANVRSSDPSQKSAKSADEDYKKLARETIAPYLSGEPTRAGGSEIEKKKDPLNLGR